MKQVLENIYAYTRVYFEHIIYFNIVMWITQAPIEKMIYNF